mmetsp:Transcript_33174/g.80189  ORF Transcript_33174/g.80189 Transcript_33174/m.80189 type:complete len:96 (+) Transcript_33174:2396-2683(+)
MLGVVFQISKKGRTGRPLETVSPILALLTLLDCLFELAWFLTRFCLAGMLTETVHLSINNLIDHEVGVIINKGNNMYGSGKSVQNLAQNISSRHI